MAAKKKSAPAAEAATEAPTMIAYKAFNPDMSCRGHKFEVGQKPDPLSIRWRPHDQKSVGEQYVEMKLGPISDDSAMKQVWVNSDDWVGAIKSGITRQVGPSDEEKPHD